VQCLQFQVTNSATGAYRVVQEPYPLAQQVQRVITRYNALILAAGQATAKPGLQALLDSCQARQPQLVEQMATMMTELEHMSVLWVEQWHIALLEMQVLFC